MDDAFCGASSDMSYPEEDEWCDVGDISHTVLFRPNVQVTVGGPLANVSPTSSPNPYLFASFQAGSDYEQLPSQWKEELRTKRRRADRQARPAAATADKDGNLLYVPSHQLIHSLTVIV
jgi:hypothetical protein